MDEENTIIPLPPKMGDATLVFGLRPDDPLLQSNALSLGLGGALIEADCQTITTADLQRGQARRAICTLFAAPAFAQNDAVSVIEALMALGFVGEVVVLAPPLLRPKMVEGELRSLSRSLRIRLLAGALPPITDM
jgi:hypothetical protein